MKCQIFTIAGFYNAVLNKEWEISVRAKDTDRVEFGPCILKGQAIIRAVCEEYGIAITVKKTYYFNPERVLKSFNISNSFADGSIELDFEGFEITKLSGVSKEEIYNFLPSAFKDELDIKYFIAKFIYEDEIARANGAYC